MVIEEGKCTGCSACVNICPRKCIKMQENEEGFLFPVIDQEKCINCGLCKKNCPILNKKEKEKIIDSLALKNSRGDIIEKSSSGGLFYELACWIIDNEGYVVGAGYDQLFNVEHQIINNKNDINKLMTSKYVQSKIGNIYFKVKKQLENNKYVLFTGTPCQVSGLKSYLKKEYDKLFCVDLVCHGVPSPKVFSLYLDYIKKHKLNDEKITSVNFRSKIVDWKKFSFHIKSENNEYHELLYVDSYMKGFLNNLYLRKSCHECIYKIYSSGADITMADAWGIDEVNPSFYNSRGVSLAIVNTKKGKKLLKNVCSYFDITSFKYSDIKKFNSCVYTPSIPHKNRNNFFKCLTKSKNIKKLIDTSLNVSLRTKIVGKLKEIYSRLLLYRAYFVYKFKSSNVPFCVLDIDDSFNYILKNNSSIIRFGDGELAIIEGTDIGFQNQSDELSSRLKEILTSDIEGLEVCIPDIFSSLDIYTEEARNFWMLNLFNSRKIWYKYCKNKRYLNSFLSRPYIEIENKKKSEIYFKKIKQIFKNKDVVLIEGKYSRLGVGNDLFDDVKSLQRILCPTKNAYEKYNEILREACKVSKKKLILISLGPTAKVLAYDLFKKGYRVIDIGHIDLEYEWFLKKCTKKINIKNKFVNEVLESDDLFDVGDEKYKKQIIVEIQ